MIGKDGLLRVRSCDSNAAVLRAAAVAAHASASQRADRPPSNSACRVYSRSTVVVMVMVIRPARPSTAVPAWAHLAHLKRFGHYGGQARSEAMAMGRARTILYFCG